MTDETKQPEVQTPEVVNVGEPTGTQATPLPTGSSAPAAAANTTSTTAATDSAASAIGTTGTEAPEVAQPGEGVQGADASGGTVASAASEGDAPLAAISPIPSLNTGDAPSATSSSPTPTANGTDSSGATSTTDLTAGTDAGNDSASANAPGSAGAAPDANLETPLSVDQASGLTFGEPAASGTHSGSSLEVHSLFQRFKEQVGAFGAFISAEEHAVIDGLKSKILGE